MESGDGHMRMVQGPVVEAADPWDPELRTAELGRPGEPVPTEPAEPEQDDPIVPPRDANLPGWLARWRGVLRRCVLGLLPIGLIAALPMHFFVGRVDDTVVAAPALSDLLGGFGLLLLPLMWLAYFAVSALPLVLALAGGAAVALAEGAAGSLPGPRRVWRLVANRLRPLWLWFAAFSLLTQSLPLLLTADRLGPAVAVPLAIGLTALSTAVLTFLGVLGCVVMIEREHSRRRALHLCSRGRLGELAVASLGVTVLPRLADAVWGGIASTVVAVATVLLWAIAALVTYAQARRAEGRVTSVSLFAELCAPEPD
ncbi:hypothetical protein ODJ79_26005 [Actinoplanes sp. KI2]|uniref:hypothetical protein n=1 Tax=Actinoplanes sp. KI2 TaxID=2983315 RepID=UPI0021D59055|nr:hypothetical protein [Actinoplanes sp. KI2]MCU7727198.1 hypothetical protein [Actinoplanes sp. KI2]